MKYSTLEFSGHAVRRMFERRVQVDAVIDVISRGEVIAEYLDDLPYPSYLVLGWTGGVPLHVLVAVEQTTEKARVVTVYVPDLQTWTDDFKARRTR